MLRARLGRMWKTKIEEEKKEETGDVADARHATENVKPVTMGESADKEYETRVA